MIIETDVKPIPPAQMAAIQAAAKQLLKEGRVTTLLDAFVMAQEYVERNPVMPSVVTRTLTPR